MSFDFNDHPTTHLIEGLLRAHHRHERLKVTALNYGKNDNSTYREAVVANVDHFLDLTEASHAEADSLVRDAAPHILVDLQGHTLGGRPDITARRHSRETKAEFQLHAQHIVTSAASKPYFCFMQSNTPKIHPHVIRHFSTASPSDRRPYK